MIIDNNYCLKYLHSFKASEIPELSGDIVHVDKSGRFDVDVVLKCFSWDLGNLAMIIDNDYSLK
jgi:hypothetical protein